MIRVGVGSASEIKLLAAHDALVRVGLLDRAWLVSRGTASGIDEQPIGADLTAFGAENRAREVLRECDVDFAIGVESGIDLVRGHWLDRAAVMILSRDGAVVGFATSIGIPLPQDAVLAAMKAGPAKRTAGEYMAHGYGGSSKDGTSTITRGRISRRMALADAIFVALLQVPVLSEGAQ